MLQIKLSTLSVALGALVVALNVYGVLKPGAFAATARRFPRHIPAGVALMLLGTVWFLFNLSQESISDFANFKAIFYLLFAGVGIGSCFFLTDFLGARGFAVVLLLLARLMVDTARWVDTEWRLVIAGWAYLMVVAGMWITISPWRLRDAIEWTCASETRTRLLSAVRLAFGVFVIGLGLTVFPAAERKDPLALLQAPSSGAVCPAGTMPAAAA